MIYKTKYLIIMLFCGITFAQETSFSFATMFGKASMLGLTETIDVNLDYVEGSIFLNDDFVKGVVIDNTNELSTEMYMRYDVYNDKFHLLAGRNLSKVYTLPKTENYEFEYNNKKFIAIKLPSSVNLENKSTINYLQVIENFTENISLYKKYSKEFLHKQRAITPFERDQSAKFIDKTNYILKVNNTYKELTLNRKRILDAFSEDKNAQLKTFLESNNYRFKGSQEEKEVQLIDLINYYLSLERSETS